jgi:hypothetical protein
MRLVFRPSLNRFIARLMCWMLLFGWMAGAANACVLQLPAAALAPQAGVHEHAASEAGHHHRHEAVGFDHGHDADGHDATVGQQACKSLCDSEQYAATKASTWDMPWLACAVSVTAGSCLILPTQEPVRVPRPDAGTLPAPPPISIAFLRLTI